MKILVISKRRLYTGFIIIVMLCAGILLWRSLAKSTLWYTNENEPIRNVDPESNKFAITCNVDWGNEVIPDILKTLEEENVKITFFVTGRWASNNPEILKEIYSHGHEIGNHGYSHKMHSKIDRETNRMEIKKTEEVIESILGIKTHYFAPPSGDFNELTLEVAQELGYKTILWSVDTIDWKEGSTAQVILDRVLKKPHKGGILLMHPKPETAKALPVIIKNIKKENIQLGTVSDLLN
ncbi:putative sporulation protein (polysaccharide deacetylase family) [Anaerosolibacter carboniphilus]|uniref:Putative sporulation protein (Polysaccharide deacetylase family) n=1 Tax=Anaerosolibacter carboniphilus TaxID=1417629 RepID=A0A841KUV2_9FIRM|nr:polysaccharide deacetylase family protein [Anaerosolibacter carboniphilus]MBB6217474.1 putative sporulation protein (polysaccharide deacetylase family) [Anaerosolibacter carboniphilus]